jgi:ADP-ribose pyrophosphatase
MVDEESIGGWKFLRQEEAYRRFVRVTKDYYTAPNGTAHIFDVIETPDAAVIFARTRDKKILGLRQFRPGPHKMCFDIPGGYIDEGETPAEAAMRELKEETGYTGDAPVEIGTVFAGPYATCIIHVFLVENAFKAGSQNLDNSEDVEVGLYTKEEVEEWIAEGTTTQTDAILLAYHYLAQHGMA